MAESEWDRIRQAKNAARGAAANLPFEEKLQILESLRARAHALSAWRQERRLIGAENLSSSLASITQIVEGGSVSSAGTIRLNAAFGADQSLVAGSQATPGAMTMIAAGRIISSTSRTK